MSSRPRLCAAPAPHASWPSLVLILIAVAGPARAAPGDADEPPPGTTRVPRLGIDLGFSRVEGFVDVRENAVEGTRLGLHDLGIDHATAVALAFELPVGDTADIRTRLRAYYMRGSSDFDQDVAFNGNVFPAGSTLHSAPALWDLLIHYRQDLLGLGDGGRLQLLLGLDYHHLDFKISGTHTVASGGDTAENFAKQELPLPSLGLRVEYPLSDHVDLYTEAFGFRAIGWNSLRKEGGTVTLSQDNFEWNLGVRWDLSASLDLEAGVRFDYLRIDETSEEDGNQFLMQSFGPFAALSLRF